MKKVLIAGESWIKHITHIKGFDIFTNCEYEEGVEWLKKALRSGGWEVEYMPSHYVWEHFPYSLSELKNFDSIILSDVGSNTFLLSPETFAHSKAVPDRLELLKEYVSEGGGFLMIGGYMSFSGIDGKARYGTTPLSDVLPVKIQDIDDRVEKPNGIEPIVIKKGHPILNGISGVWPKLLGYNKTILKDDSEIIVTINNDPLIAVREYVSGRVAVFTSDCAPHWGSPEFLEWPYYTTLWNNLLNWLANIK
jgi:uncharacterized membrane protein